MFELKKKRQKKKEIKEKEKKWWSNNIVLPLVAHHDPLSSSHWRFLGYRLDELRRKWFHKSMCFPFIGFCLYSLRQWLGLVIFTLVSLRISKLKKSLLSFMFHIAPCIIFTHCSIKVHFIMGNKLNMLHLNISKQKQDKPTMKYKGWLVEVILS